MGIYAICQFYKIISGIKLYLT